MTPRTLTRSLSSVPSPVHWDRCSDQVWWSTVNAGEAIPGVVTPLTGSFFSDHFEPAMKGTFYDMGILTAADVCAPPLVDDRLLGFFFGRACGNLSLFRRIGDSTPGTSGNAIEEQIFGHVREGVGSAPNYRRYPFVAVRAPYAAIRALPRLRAATGSIGPWWRESVAPGSVGSAPAARALLRDAAERFERVMRPHTTVAMLCQGMYDQLKALAADAGEPGLELALATGYGNMAETAVVSDLWAVSRGRLTLDQFIVRHGFHGPAEGDLASRVWRIDRDPVRQLLGGYRELSENREPRHVEHARREERLAAERRLLAGLPVARRGRGRVVLRAAANFIPQRGTGKAAFLRCIDVARRAARHLGEDMAHRGVLDEPEDVFMLSLAELLDASERSGLRELAQIRRTEHEYFQTVELPGMFSGVPVSVQASDSATVERAPADGVVTGAAVSPGVVEGIARVVTTPAVEDGFEPGEILVCRTTDPSWASIMMLAAALVIDIGGPISHGAIVARELGVPCVIGTRDGTARIRTGDRIRVDGAKGEVTIIEGVE